MRILVTGASGFVGRHAVRDLIRAGHEVIGMVGPGQPTQIEGLSTVIEADLLHPPSLAELIRKHQPDACLHLAGIAFVPVGWTHPQDVFRVNVIGTVNLLESFREFKPEARILVITSSQVYGQQPRDHLITEDDAPAPDNIYALSKWTADGTSLLYARRYGMKIMTARPCNHIGPGQSEDFVVTSFARQLIDISTGKRPHVMKVGNLASLREFTDVRDTARAYRLLLEKGTAGLAYNVSSGKLTTIQALFDLLRNISGVNPEVQIDPERFRTTDTQPLLDSTRIFNDVGWKPEIPIETTISDVLADLRAKG